MYLHAHLNSMLGHLQCHQPDHHLAAASSSLASGFPIHPCYLNICLPDIRLPGAHLPVAPEAALLGPLPSVLLSQSPASTRLCFLLQQLATPLECVFTIVPH